MADVVSVQHEDTHPKRVDRVGRYALQLRRRRLADPPMPASLCPLHVAKGMREVNQIHGPRWSNPVMVA